VYVTSAPKKTKKKQKKKERKKRKKVLAMCIHGFQMSKPFLNNVGTFWYSEEMPFSPELIPAQTFY